MQTPEQTKAFYETEFNVKLTGSMLISLQWYCNHYKDFHRKFWDTSHPEYCQEFVDEFAVMMDTLKEPNKNFVVD